MVELLADVEKIRTERRKAKSNRHKYVGTGNEGLSFQSGGSRYGGFGSDNANYNNGLFYIWLKGPNSLSFIDYYRSGVGGGGGGGGGSSSFRDDTRRGGFEEYDAGDDEDDAKPNSSPTRKTPMRTSTSKAAAPKPTPAPAPAPVVDLIGGLDDDTFGNPSTALNPNKALPSVDTKQTVGFDGIGSICYLHM